ncbi:MAG: hypothetical protein MZW92_70155 [Comamonadaceae bacterium]|nr:hypothetical protein [Comamonadaceae bacterium]
MHAPPCPRRDVLAFAPPHAAAPPSPPGKRFTLPRPLGSADALLLARLARSAQARQRAAGRRHRRAGRRAAPGRRDCPSSRPACACAVFPDWETLPYDTFSPHQDLISERLATLWRAAAARDGRRACCCRRPPR